MIRPTGPVRHFYRTPNGWWTEGSAIDRPNVAATAMVWPTEKRWALRINTRLGAGSRYAARGRISYHRSEANAVAFLGLPGAHR